MTDYESLSSELLGKEVTLKPVATPFLEDDHKSSPARTPASYDPSTPLCPWCKIPCNTTVKDVETFEKEIRIKRAKNAKAKEDKKAAHTPTGSFTGAVDSCDKEEK